MTPCPRPLSITQRHRNPREPAGPRLVQGIDALLARFTAIGNILLFDTAVRPLAVCSPFLNKLASHNPSPPCSPATDRAPTCAQVSNHNICNRCAVCATALGRGTCVGVCARVSVVVVWASVTRVPPHRPPMPSMTVNKRCMSLLKPMTAQQATRHQGSSRCVIVQAQVDTRVMNLSLTHHSAYHLVCRHQSDCELGPQTRD